MSDIKSPDGKKLVFAPGCFDEFDGTQEELDQMVAEITKMFSNGELLEKSSPVDMDSLMEELSEEEVIKLLESFSDIEEGNITDNRTLQ